MLCSVNVSLELDVEVPVADVEVGSTEVVAIATIFFKWYTQQTSYLM